MSPQSSWILQEEIVPRLRSAIPNNVNKIGSEDAQELIQDSICMAAKLLTNAENQNKSVTPGNIAYYTILHMKSGRRSYGSSTVDVLGTGTQLNGKSTTTSFDEVVDVNELGEEFTVNDVFSDDHEDGPASQHNSPGRNPRRHRKCRGRASLLSPRSVPISNTRNY